MNKAAYVEAQHIRTLVTAGPSRWGDPIENRKKLIPYGWKLIDKAVWGIDVAFIVLQGEEKMRKSTVMYNIIKNIMTGDKPEVKPHIVLDTLESSSGPDVVSDIFICMLASEILMDAGHRSDNGACPRCGGKRCNQLVLSSRSLPYITKTREQQNAINLAIKELETWNLTVFGPGINEGNTRDMEGSVRRWEWMIDEYDASLFISDHIQQYHLPKAVTDYEKQQVAVPFLSTFVGQNKKTLLALSQVSLTARKNAKDGARQYATGGAKMAAEAGTVLRSLYDEDQPTVVGVGIVESRHSGKLTTWGRIDPTSGLMYGEMTLDHPAIDERPMTPDEEKGSPY
jgi:hypothetical protein